VSQLCVNTLLATKVTLIKDGIYFVSLRVNSLFEILILAGTCLMYLALEVIGQSVDW
jgi:hypothetical protein